VTHVTGAKPLKTLNQDKGQAAAVAEVTARLARGEGSPLALEAIVAVSRATFAIQRSLETGHAAEVAE
jgi:hypothetical protein